MSNTERDTLAAECRAFSHYLIGQVPSEYVVQKYCTAHLDGNILHSPDSDALDTILVRLARRHHVLTGMVDLYTSLFFKRAIVRRKLVLLLAILESAGTTYAYFDSTDSLTRLGFGLRLLRRGLTLGALMLVALVTLLPLHVGLRSRSEHGFSGARNNGRHAPRA